MTRPIVYKLAIGTATVGVCVVLLLTLPRGRSIDFVDHAQLEGTELTAETAVVIFPNLKNTGKRPRHRFDKSAG